MIALGLLCAALLWSGSSGQSDNSTCLRFQELPASPSAADQQRTILENGLQAWATVPHAFIDATGERGLPIALLRQTVPPLLTGNQSSLSGAEVGPFVQQLFQQYGAWWAPVLVVTLLGVVFAIAFAVTGLVFCCCRCCGKCGGSRQQNKSKHEGIIKISIGLILVIFLILILIGAIIALVGNEQVNQNVANINQEISSVIGELREYVNTSVYELDFVFDQSNVAVNCSVDFLQESLTAAAMGIGRTVQDNITTVLGRAADTSQSLSTALSTLNRTILNLQTLQSQVSALNGSLAILRDNLTSLATQCEAAQPGAQTCVDIATARDQAQLSQGIDVGTQISNLTSLRDSLLSVQGQLDAAIMMTNATFDNFTTIFDQLNTAVDEVVQTLQNFTAEYQSSIEMLLFSSLQNILAAFDLAPPGQPPPEGAITAAQNTLTSATDFVQSSQRIVYGFVILMCCFVLIVVAVLVGALLCATVSHSRKGVPWDRNKLSHCTAITLLIGVGLMFLFAFLLLILCSVVFFLAAMGQKICYSAGQESNYAIFSEFTDAPVWNGNQTLFQFLSQGRLNLTASGILVSCEDNDALFQTFNVQSIISQTGLPLDDVADLAQLIPPTSTLLAKLPADISFSPDSVVFPPEVTQLLRDLEANVNQFSLTSNINDLNQPISDTTVDGLLNSLAQWRTDFNDSASQISELELFVNTTLRQQTGAANMTKDQVVMDLTQLQAEGMTVMTSANATLAAVDSVVAALDGLNATTILTPPIESTRATLVDFANNYTSYALDTIMNEVGRCRPIFNSYSDVYTRVCDFTLVGLNAFWWSLGWCVLLFIPTIVLSIILARYYTRMTGPKGYGDQAGRTSSFAMNEKYY